MKARTRLLLLGVLLLPLSTGCNRAEVVASSSQGQTANADSTGIQEKTFDDLKFDIELTDKFERSMLTPKIEKLFGHDIRIRGYIYPTLKTKGLKQFVLVRDNLECCFGPGAALFDCILVHMNEGQTAEFSIRPVAVEGTFSFEEFTDYDGTTRAIYRLDGQSVR